ncbi:uncharacterized protein LOC117792221 [Drosophila innubila]|uniref:uncharacterized protein LOC117792221 n=1 Tax=Drosophila innubila TaxID=198719 RepID=UPI00148D8348|nr:uncharacterized protein LOC117792221 [Drosophila innubila]
MLNKLEFNNLVITNKKTIQQARSQTIAKVVQKLRKVKDALAKKPDNEVNKARQRKNVEYIAQLKSLKSVDIMRSLLLKDEKKHNAILTNGRATPDEVVIAMLGLNKVMQGLVAKFQETLNLSSDPNANWREEILQTSKRRLKLERTEEKRRKRKELKELKLQSRKRLEWLEQNKPEGELDEKETPESETKITTTNAVVCLVEKVNKTAKPPVKVDTISSNDKPKKSDKVPKAQNSQEPKGKRVQNKQKVQEKSNKSEPEVKYEPMKPKEEEKERPTHVVDPFFITESGQPYLSTAVVMSDDNNDTDNDEYQPEQKRRKPMTNRQEYRQENSRTRITERPILTNFKGKKTKFAEDGSAAETTSPFASPAAESSEAGMHPSWIAKQRLKPKIASFAGTKIKFDD